MIDYRRFVPIVAAAALGLMVAVPASAQQPAKPADKNEDKLSAQQQARRVAVLDVRRIFREAKAMQGIRKQIAEMGGNMRKEIEKKQDALRAANQELSKKRAILSPDAFGEERRKFDQQVAEVQRLVQTSNQQLEKANALAVRKLQKVYNDVVLELARERALGLVFRKSATVIVHPPLEITAEVLARLDKRLPSVKVSLPEPKK